MKFLLLPLALVNYTTAVYLTFYFDGWSGFYFLILGWLTTWAILKLCSKLFLEEENEEAQRKA